MKKEEGLVIDISGENARVKVGRHNECKSCGACPGDSILVIDALNKVGAKAGDRVEFEIADRNMILSSFVVFIMPLFLMVIGAYCGRQLGLSEIICGVAGFLLALVLVKVFDMSLGKNNKSLPVIKRII